MTDKKNYRAVLSTLTPSIIGYYVKDFSVPIEQAREDYFNSKLYFELENTDNGLWHYSARLLAELLHDEKVNNSYSVPEVAA